MPSLKALYLGSSAKMTEVLARHFLLQAAVCESDRYNVHQYNVCEWLAIPYRSISDAQGLGRLDLPAAQVAISYGIGIIFGEPEISLFEHGIWNIHAGTLPEYRGRHPISWAMINGDREVGICVHRIDTQIDRGFLLASSSVPRWMDDTQDDIEARIFETIDAVLLGAAIDVGLRDGGTPVGEGMYHRSLTGGFGDIDPAIVDSHFLFNLLRSQATHGGVRVKGKIYRSGYFYHPDFAGVFNNAEIVTCKDMKQIALFADLVEPALK